MVVEIRPETVDGRSRPRRWTHDPRTDGSTPMEGHICCSGKRASTCSSTHGTSSRFETCAGVRRAGGDVGARRVRRLGAMLAPAFECRAIAGCTLVVCPMGRVRAWRAGAKPGKPGPAPSPA